MRLVPESQAPARRQWLLLAVSAAVAVLAGTAVPAAAGVTHKKTYQASQKAPLVLRRTQRSSQALLSKPDSHVIYGRSIWVCSPSGFGKRSSCYARQ